MAILDELIEKSQDFDSHKDDHEVVAAELNFNPGGDIVMATKYGPMNLQPTEHALSQVFDRLGNATYGSALPQKHMLSIPRELMAYDLNYLMPSMGKKNRVPWLVRCYDSTARACLTTEYTVLQNTQVMETVAEAVRNRVFSAQEIHSPTVTPDQINLKITTVNVNTDDGPYGIGAYVRNDEIGRGRVEMRPYLKRGKCDNTIIFPGDADMSHVHRGSLRRIMYEIYSALQHAFQLSQTWLQTLLDAEMEQLPKMDEMIDQMAKKYAWSIDIRQAVAFGSEGRDTVAGLVHGITYAAHTQLQGDDQIDMECLAGQFLRSMTTKREALRQ